MKEFESKLNELISRRELQSLEEKYTEKAQAVQSKLNLMKPVNLLYKRVYNHHSRLSFVSISIQVYKHHTKRSKQPVKEQKMICLNVGLSLSLSLSHTHAHTHNTCMYSHTNYSDAIPLSFTQCKKKWTCSTV